MNEKKTPRIRFKGFTDDWEQRKVGELTNVLSASRVHKEEWAEDGIPFFRSSDVVSAFKGTENEKAFISVELYEQLAKSSGKLEKNDILITGGGSIGIPYIVPDNKPLYSKDADLIWIKHSANFDSRYLYTYFISEEFREYLASISHTGTIAHYTIEQVKNTPVRLPSIDEQRELGDFFVSFDHLITLHQRKYEKLQIIKKSMLENCFPKNGEKVPRIRFAGFTGDWEQRKLSDVANVYDGVHQTPDYQKSGVMFLSVENIATLTSDKYITQEAFERDYKNYPEKGDILMTRIGDVGTPNVVETVEKVAFYVSLALLKPKNVDSYFLCNAICSPEFQRGLKNRTLVTAIPQKINKDEIGKVEFLMPKNTAEQKAIGAYFKNLDHLITLHQSKLEKLQKIKKSLLERMFA